MARRKRRTFTDEFKTEVVGLCQRGDRTIPQVARDLDLTVSAVRGWVKQAEVDAGDGPPEALTSAEQQPIAANRTPKFPEARNHAAEYRRAATPTATVRAAEQPAQLTAQVGALAPGPAVID